MSADRRLVLCRPLGGLNDILCQIELACTYAERFGRTVVVDTAEHSDRYFRDLFSNYFQSARTNLVLGLDAIRRRLDVLDTVPTFLAGRVSRYRMQFDRTQKSSSRPRPGFRSPSTSGATTPSRCSSTI